MTSLFLKGVLWSELLVPFGHLPSPALRRVLVLMFLRISISFITLLECLDFYVLVSLRMGS